MDRITDDLFLGNLQDALAAAEGRTEIRAILQLFGPDPRPELEAEISVKQLRIVDGRAFPPELLEEALEFIREQRGWGPVLVCCGAGMSRSPTVVAAFLCEAGVPLAEAFEMIITARRCVLPHPELVRSLGERYAPGSSVEQLLAEIVRLRSRRTAAPPAS